MDFGTFPSSEPPRHKVFLSFHHGGDFHYRDSFVRQFQAAFVDYSVRPGDIADHLSTERVRQLIRDEYIRDATVTIVLIGAATWQRKHVDWEIDSSLRDTRLNSRTGLLGILLPSYAPISGQYSTYVFGSDSTRLPDRWTAPTRSVYSPNNIPPRLWDNVDAGFAAMRPWPANASELRGWIHEAFQRRYQYPTPILSRKRFGRNRSEDQRYWQ